MPLPNFEVLNKKIRAAGADWIAGETPLSKFHGRKKKNVMLGMAYTPEQAFAGLSAARERDALRFGAAPTAIPAALDWRNHQGKNWVTPVQNQGSCGSCVAFAAAGVLEARGRIGLGQANKAIDLSEAHLFYCGTPNSCELGWHPAHALNFAATNGVGRESDFRYKPGNQPCRMIPPAARAANVDSAGTTVARKQALQSGPVIASMAVYDDFYHYTSGIYRHVSGDLLGYHAVCLIGYDDSAGFWIAKNSWDVGWGEAGFFRIRYGECGVDTQFPFDFPHTVTLM